MPINLTDRQKDLFRQLVARKDELYGHPFHIAVLGSGTPGFYIVELPGGPIFELRDFNEYVKSGLLDQVGQGSYSSYILTNLGEIAVANNFQETGTLVTDLQAILLKLYENQEQLRGRQAKYGGNVPLELNNEIGDHQIAIGLTNQLYEAVANLRRELGRLNIGADLKARLESILGEK